MKRTINCSICSIAFSYTWRSTRKRQFCSIDCIKKNSSEKRKSTCKSCKKEFIRNYSCKGVYCSLPCKYIGLKISSHDKEINFGVIKNKLKDSYSVNENGCHIWNKTIMSSGYGIIGHGRKKKILAHRAVWILNNGFINEELFVCHKCDTPTCININHLFVGTAKDNSMDMNSKGRGSGRFKKGMTPWNKKI
jgi:hypothetical protein